MGLRQNLDILPDFSDNSAFNEPKIMKIGQKLSVLLAKRHFTISSYFFVLFFRPTLFFDPKICSQLVHEFLLTNEWGTSGIWKFFYIGFLASFVFYILGAIHNRCPSKEANIRYHYCRERSKRPYMKEHLDTTSTSFIC